ncbi:MAG TPA: PsiF family protein [Methylocella sp.]|nr:PsiF family protein [Methylocella sp.]
MKTIARLMIAGTFVFALGQCGYAQTMTNPPATSAAPAAPAAPSADDAARKAKAKECSAKADAQGLHGKARKEFRAKCKRS